MSGAVADAAAAPVARLLGDEAKKAGNAKTAKGRKKRNWAWGVGSRCMGCCRAGMARQVGADHRTLRAGPVRRANGAAAGPSRRCGAWGCGATCIARPGAGTEIALPPRRMGSCLTMTGERAGCSAWHGVLPMAETDSGGSVPLAAKEELSRGSEAMHAGTCRWGGGRHAVPSQSYRLAGRAASHPHPQAHRRVLGASLPICIKPFLFRRVPCRMAGRVARSLVHGVLSRVGAAVRAPPER